MTTAAAQPGGGGFLPRRGGITIAWGAASSGQSPFHSEHPCGHSSFHSLAPHLPRKALRAFPGSLIVRLIKPSPSKGEGAPVRTLGRMRVGWCSEFGFLFDPTPPHPSGLRPSTFPLRGEGFVGEGGARLPRRAHGATLSVVRGVVGAKSIPSGTPEWAFLLSFPCPSSPRKSAARFPGAPDCAPTVPLDFVGRDDPGAPNHAAKWCWGDYQPPDPKNAERSRSCIRRSGSFCLFSSPRR